MQSILKEHVLPRLAGLGNGALWLHFAEEAVAFERGLSPLRGLPMPAGSDELAESTEEPWTDGSCLELLARQPVSPSFHSIHRHPSNCARMRHACASLICCDSRPKCHSQEAIIGKW